MMRAKGIHFVGSDFRAFLLGIGAAFAFCTTILLCLELLDRLPIKQLSNNTSTTEQDDKAHELQFESKQLIKNFFSTTLQTVASSSIFASKTMDSFGQNFFSSNHQENFSSKVRDQQDSEQDLISATRKNSHLLNHEFNCDIEYIKMENDPGYLFKLQLTPKEDYLQNSLKQNFYFLIDRSQLTSPDEYESFKWATVNALALLQDGDNFNIFLLDNQLIPFSHESVSWSHSNFYKAQEFLEQQTHTGSKKATSIYDSLEQMIPESVAEEEVYTVLLFSHGNRNMNKEEQNAAMAQWTKNNGGKLSLFVVAGKEQDLSLDLVSSMNKGMFLEASTSEELQTTVTQLIQQVQHPIGKEMETVVTSFRPSTKIHIFPTSARLPNLYERQPYVIYGYTDQLEDFQVSLEGKFYGTPFQMTQKVFLSTARQIENKSLERKWVLQRAYDDYYRYMHDEDFTALLRARQLLDSYHIQAPF